MKPHHWIKLLQTKNPFALPPEFFLARFLFAANQTEMEGTVPFKGATLNTVWNCQPSTPSETASPLSLWELANIVGIYDIGALQLLGGNFLKASRIPRIHGFSLYFPVSRNKSWTSKNTGIDSNTTILTAKQIMKVQQMHITQLWACVVWVEPFGITFGR